MENSDGEVHVTQIPQINRNNLEPKFKTNWMIVKFNFPRNINRVILFLECV